MYRVSLKAACSLQSTEDTTPTLNALCVPVTETDITWCERQQTPDDEVALDGLQNLLLKQHVLLLSLGNYVLLADALHGVICAMIHCGHLRRVMGDKAKIGNGHSSPLKC